MMTRRGSAMDAGKPRGDFIVFVLISGPSCSPPTDGPRYLQEACRASLRRSGWRMRVREPQRPFGRPARTTALAAILLVLAVPWSISPATPAWEDAMDSAPTRRTGRFL